MSEVTYWDFRCAAVEKSPPERRKDDQRHTHEALMKHSVSLIVRMIRTAAAAHQVAHMKRGR